MEVTRSMVDEFIENKIQAKAYRLLVALILNESELNYEKSKLVLGLDGIQAVMTFVKTVEPNLYTNKLNALRQKGDE